MFIKCLILFIIAAATEKTQEKEEKIQVKEEVTMKPNSTETLGNYLITNIISKKILLIIFVLF